MSTEPTIPVVVGPDYLVPILHLPIETIKTYARTRPESLPPRWKPPGIKKLLWLESDVIDWIKSYSTAKSVAKPKITLTYPPNRKALGGNNVASV